MPAHPQSNALWQRAEKVLAGGPGTLSKMPSRYPEGIAPKFLLSGDGAYVTDADGHRYVDCVAALGPILLGHHHNYVTNRVFTQIDIDGLVSSTLSTALEVEVAEQLVEMIPGAECCRFAMNGKDVTEAAVKVARYVTEKRDAIYVGYHGGFGDYLMTTDKRGGVLECLAPYNHQVQWGNTPQLIEALSNADDLAVIIAEVPPRPYGEDPSIVTAELEHLARQAHAHGALFVLDEIVTGLRYGLGGAQAYYGVKADMVTMSKALGNGYPIAAVLGPQELLKAFDGGQVFLSTTFGANPIGLAACKATLETLRETDALKTLEHYGAALLDRIAELFTLTNMPCGIRGNYARFVFDWHDYNEIDAATLRTLWLQELCRGGVLANIPWFPMCSYDDAVMLQILNAVRDAVYVISDVVSGRVAIQDALQCPIITDVFQQRYAAQERT